MNHNLTLIIKKPRKQQDHRKSEQEISKIMEEEEAFLAWTEDSGKSNEEPPRKELVDKANEIKRSYTVQLYKNKNLLILKQFRYGDYCFATENKLENARKHIKKQTLRKENEERFRNELSKITPAQLAAGQTITIEIFLTDNDSVEKLIKAHIRNIKSARDSFVGLWDNAKTVKDSIAKFGKSIS